MATEYRFLNEEKSIDVSLMTDRLAGNETFFANEIRNEDSQDILGGIVLEIQAYTEKELIDLAAEKNVALLRINKKEGLEEINSIVLLYSQFNGTSSRVRFDNVVLDAAGTLVVPVVFKQTIRFSAEDISAMFSSGDNYTILSTDSNADDYFTIVVSASSETDLNFETEASLDVGSSEVFPSLAVVNAADVDLEVSLIVEDDGGLLKGTIEVNGDSASEFNTPIPSIATSPFVVMYGSYYSSDPLYLDFFLGGMKDALITLNGTEVLNVPNLSTGENLVGDNATEIIDL